MCIRDSIHTAAIHRSLPRHAQIDAEQEMTGDSTERGVRFLEVPEHRVAEHLVAVAGVVARVAAELRTGRLEVDEPARVGDRQRLEQELMEQRIDRRVRPDAPVSYTHLTLPTSDLV